MIFLIIAGVLAIGAFIPAAIAADRGRSFWGFYVFGLFFLVPALIVALLSQRQEIAVGSFVAAVRPIELDDDVTLAAGHTAVVTGLDVADGQPMLEIEHEGSRWLVPRVDMRVR